MSEGGEGPIDIPVTSSGAEGIDRIVSAIDRLYAGLESLGSVSGLTRLEQQMQLMQASMTTGFTEIATLVQKSGNEVVAAHEKTAEEVAAINEKARDRQLNADRVFAQAHIDIAERQLQADVTFAQAQLRLAEKQAADMQALRTRSASPIDARTLLGLPSESEVRSIGTQIAAQMREAVALENLRAKSASPVDARTLLGLPSEAEMRGVGAQIAAQMRETVAAEQALAKGAAEASAEARKLGAASRAAAADHGVLNDALKQTEGAFRGAAHQAGIYGLHHGQLIALLAGGAVAAALHHIAETGAEVEYALTSLNALADQAERHPIDFDKFIGITAGTLSNLKQAAEGMAALAEAGFSQEEAMATLPSILRLATMGNMTVAESAEMAVESMHAFGKSASDIEGIGDILVAVGSKSNVSVHKLAEDMKSAATTGALFNLDMKEITATVGVLAERGLTIQPLSSALTKLYEPSAKTAKAMHDLGLSVKDGEGNLKNYSQFMSELQEKVNQFKVPADILHNLGMSSRDIKAMEVMTQHWEDYIHLLNEATGASGKMFDAMTQKEDTVEGGFLRLKSTFEGSVVRAFEDASPVIRQVENDLMHLAGSKETVSALEHLATGVARLTLLLAENGGAVAAALGVYAGFRVLAGLTTMAAEFTAAQAAQALATEAAARAAALETERLALLTVEERAAAAGSVTLAAGAEASAAGLATAAAGARLFTSALGWVGVIVTAASIAYELFRDKLSDADKDHLKTVNTIDTTIDAYQREIDRLKNLEDQLRLTGKAGVESAGQVALAQAVWNRAEAQTRLADIDRTKPAPTSFLPMAGRGGASVDVRTMAWQQQRNEAQKAVEEADRQLQKMEGLTAALTAQQTATHEAQSVADLKKKISEFPDTVVPAAKTKAAQEAAAAANRELADLRAQEVSSTNLVRLSKEALDVEEKIKQTKLDAAAAGGNDKRAAADAYRARVTELDEELQQAQKAAQTAQRDLESAYKTGAISAVEAAQKEHDAQVASLNTAIEIAHKKAALATGKENGQNDIAQASKAESAARAGIREADAKLERDYDEILRKSAAETTQFRIDQAKKEGDTALAYQLAHAVEIAQIDKGLADSAKLLLDSVAEGDTAAIARAKKLLDAFAGAKARADAAIATAVNADAISRSEKEFKNLFTTLSTGVADLQRRADPSAGVVTMLSAAREEAQLYERMLPQLIAKQKELAALVADPSATPDQKTRATAEMAQIEAAAERARNVWVDVSKSIGKGLADAFGQGGKALSDLLTASLAYGAQQQKIQADLDKAGKTPEAKRKAAEDTASAQVHAYGEMAQAAAGFFGQQSKGYQTLMAVSQAFHAAELLATTAELVPKAISAVLTQGEGDPYTAFGRMAAMTALVAGLGVAITGGGGADHTAENRQKAQGTGTVLGDPDAKSQSIARAVQLSAANSNIELNYTAAMAASLHSIESNIGNFAAQVVRTSGINGDPKGLNLSNGPLSKSTSNVLSAGLAVDWGIAGMAFGPLGALAGALAGALLGHLANSIFGGKQTLTDSGFTMGRQSLGSVAAYGTNAYQYTDIKTDGGWFRGDSHDTRYNSLGADANAQFTLVLKGLSNSVTEAAKLLGLGGAAFTAKLNTFVVDIGNISLKGKTGDEIQKELEAAFSKVGDQMAQFAVGGLEKYAKVGEGYFETLTRVATDYASVGAIFDSLGKSLTVVSASTTAFGDHVGGFMGRLVNGFVDYMKQSLPTVSTLSVEARERLVDLAGGIDKMASQASGFAQNFLTKAEQLAPVSKYVNDQLAALGYTSIKTRDDFKNLILGLDVSTQKGAEQYTALMALQDAFAKTHAATVDLTKTEQEIADERTSLLDQLNQLTKTEAQLTQIERAKLDASNRALFDQVQAAKAVKAAKDTLASAYDTERQSIQSTIDRLKTLASGWKQFRDGLTLGDKSPLTPGQKYEEARNQYLSTLTAARSGDTAAQGQYQTAATAFLDASRAANASSQQYTNDFNSVLKATDEATSWAQQQVDVAQQSLQALDASVSTLIDIKKGVISVQQAIDNLAHVSQLYQATVPSSTALSTPTPAGQILPGGVNDIAAILRGTSQYNTPAYVADPLAGSGARQVQQAPADAPTKAQMDALLKEIASLKEQMAKSSQDGTDANVDATLEAAGIVADRFERAAGAVAWKERVRPANK